MRSVIRRASSGAVRPLAGSSATRGPAKRFQANRRRCWSNAVLVDLMRSLRRSSRTRASAWRGRASAVLSAVAVAMRKPTKWYRTRSSYQSSNVCVSFLNSCHKSHTFPGFTSSSAWNSRNVASGSLARSSALRSCFIRMKTSNRYSMRAGRSKLLLCRKYQ